ncbi:LOB domain-containing protein 25 [Glycine soja]|nr:LOB domain-containing protein 25 [Glycine soja]
MRGGRERGGRTLEGEAKRTKKGIGVAETERSNGDIDCLSPRSRGARLRPRQGGSGKRRWWWHHLKIMASSSYSNSPCDACKFLRKCMMDCIFSPYFPPKEPQKFANMHKIFGACNVSKLQNEVQPYQREDAVNSLAYEAEAWIEDPVYGCVGAISVLLKVQILHQHRERTFVQMQIVYYTGPTEISKCKLIAFDVGVAMPFAAITAQICLSRGISFHSH